VLMSENDPLQTFGKRCSVQRKRPHPTTFSPGIKRLCCASARVMVYASKMMAWGFLPPRERTG
jgi:hypothetical protein